MIAASLKPLRDAGLEPVGVDLSAFGMIRALGDTAGRRPPRRRGMHPTASSVLYCNVGDVTNLAVAKGRSCLFTRVSPVGLDDMAASLAAGAGLTPEHARMWLDHVGLAQPVEQIEGDPTTVARPRTRSSAGPTRCSTSCASRSTSTAPRRRAVPVERVVVCGPGSAIPGLAEHMEPALGLPISIGRPEALADLDAASAARLTLPYGLALEQ